MDGMYRYKYRKLIELYDLWEDKCYIIMVKTINNENYQETDFRRHEIMPKLK
jgi:hypothetical protein